MFLVLSQLFVVFASSLAKLKKIQTLAKNQVFLIQKFEHMEVHLANYMGESKEIQGKFKEIRGESEVSPQFSTDSPWISFDFPAFSHIAARRNCICSRSCEKRFKFTSKINLNNHLCLTFSVLNENCSVICVCI